MSVTMPCPICHQDRAPDEMIQRAVYEPIDAAAPSSYDWTCGPCLYGHDWPRVHAVLTDPWLRGGGNPKSPTQRRLFPPKSPPPRRPFPVVPREEAMSAGHGGQPWDGDAILGLDSSGEEL